MPSTSTPYDLVIIGGGPAGCAAAIAARRHNLHTIIVTGSGEQPSSCSCAGWVGPAAMQACTERGVEVSKLGVRFSGVRLWTWDLTRHVEVSDPDLTGWVVEPAALTTALLRAVRSAGALPLENTTAVTIRPGEESVTVEMSSGPAVAGRVAVLADGAGSQTISRAQLTSSPPPEPGGAALAVLEAKCSDDKLDVILSASRALKVLVVARGSRHTRVALLSRDGSSRATDQLTAILKTAEKAGIVPAGSAGTVLAAPGLAGLALELESHVGKRCLVVGDAGGFVTAFSNEGLYPALRSGWLAAETAARALKAAVLQDELASFGAVWRSELADYMRMPNTDLGLLLPMVFGNPQMSRRLARAFLLGQAF